MSRYEKYKDSGIAWIGEIPEHWKLVSIKSIFNRRSQKNNPIISTERLSLSIEKGVTLYSDKTTNLDRFKDDFTQYQLAYPKDIVLNCMNMIVGAIGISKYTGCVSPVYYVIYPKNADSINVEYYNYLLNTTGIKSLYRSLGQGIYAIDRGDGRVNTCRLKVSYDDFGAIKIPIPSFNVQEVIAEFLDRKCVEIDELVALQETMIEELVAYKQSVITEAVTRGLNPDAPLRDSGIEWIGSIPAHWEILRLKNISTGFSNGTSAEQLSSDKSPYKVTRIETISLGVINYDKVGYVLNDNNEVCRYKMRKNDILISNINSYKMIGNCALYNGEEELYHGMNLIRISPNNRISAQFLLYYLKIDLFTGQMKRACKPAINQVSVPASVIKGMQIAYPPIQEQQAIADHLDRKCEEIDQLIAIKREKIEQLKEYKKSVIFEYVTGKKRVN